MNNAINDLLKKALVVDIIIIVPFIGMFTAFVNMDGNVMMWTSYALCGAYFIFKDVFNGQSLGKRAYKLAIVDNDGGVPSFKQIFIRNGTFFLLCVIELYRVYYLDKPCLGDVWAKTKVVEVGK